MFEILSPSDAKIEARFLRSASAYKIIAFEMLLGGSMSLISYRSAVMPQASESFSIALTILLLSDSLSSKSLSSVSLPISLRIVV